MFSFIKEFFVDKQTFASTVADGVGALALLAATPEGMTAISSLLGPWAMIGVAGAAYIAGGVSGRKTKPIDPGKIIKRYRREG